MTKEELERHLEIRTILDLKGIEVHEGDLIDCPLHTGCKKSLKLYPELNGVACLRETCNKYRKMFSVFELLQELENCDTRQTILIGKSLIFKELEYYRSRYQWRSLNKPKAVELTDKMKKVYEQIRIHFIGKEFRIKQVRMGLRLRQGRSTLRHYFRALTYHGYLEKIGGNNQKGYLYKLLEKPMNTNV